MQGRVGPRLLQPFYDVAKLLRKAPASVNTMDDTYMACALIFTVVAAASLCRAPTRCCVPLW